MDLRDTRVSVRTDSDGSRNKLQLSNFKKTEPRKISNIDIQKQFLRVPRSQNSFYRTLLAARKCKLDVKIPTNSSLGKLAKEHPLKIPLLILSSISENFNTLRSKTFPFDDALPTEHIRTEIFNNFLGEKCPNSRGRLTFPSRISFSVRNPPLLKLPRAIDIVSFDIGEKNETSPVGSSRTPRNFPRKTFLDQAVNLKLPIAPRVSSC